MSTAHKGSKSSPAMAAALVPSPRISEIVLRTSNFDAMQEWYQTALSAQPSFEYATTDGGPHSTTRSLNFHRLCFLRIFSEFPYTQVLALFEIPDMQRPTGSTSGLHHMQFRQASLDEWADRYESLAKLGITPAETYNHGPSMSCYYEDPDGNLAEFSGPNFTTDAEYRAFFASPEFARNPAGVAVDVVDFIKRLRAGEDRRELVKLPAA